MFRHSSPIPSGARRFAGRLAGLILVMASGDVNAQSGPTAAQKPMIDTFVSRTGLPRTWVVSVKPDIVVAIRDRDGLVARTPGEKVRLQGDVVDDEAAQRLGYRSMRSLVEINCETRRDRVVEMEVFSEHNLKGAGQKRALPGGWVQPSEDAYMADVVRAICRAAPQRSDPPPPPEPSPAVLKPAIVATPPKPTPRPAPQSIAPPVTPTRGNLAVQVGALDTATAAHRTLSGLAGLIAAPLATQVQPARIGERTFYRALVAGFRSRAEANTFCAAVTRQGGSCFIR